MVRASQCGQLHLACGAMQEPGAKRCFEFCDVPADRRLRHAERPSGGGKAADLDHFCKQRDMIQIGHFRCQGWNSLSRMSCLAHHRANGHSRSKGHLHANGRTSGCRGARPVPSRATASPRQAGDQDATDRTGTFIPAAATGFVLGALGATALVGNAVAQTSEPATAAAQPSAVYMTMEEIDWRPLNPSNPDGPTMSVLWGDPTQGPYGASALPGRLGVATA